MNKRIISFILLVAAVAVFTFNGSQINIKAASAETVSNIVETVSDSADTKTYNTNKLEDEFSDEIILVTLTKEATQKFQTYTEKDFLELKNIRVEEITASTNNKVKKQMESEKMGVTENTNSEQMKFNTATYRRILEITLLDEGKENVLNAIKLLEKREDILSANPSMPGSVCATYPGEYSTLVSDQRWALDKINAPNAWDIEKGSSAVTVAVIDSGIDANHKELINKMSTIPSYDYITNSYGSTDPLGHGTHVAGIIAAQANNDGTVGVAWDVRLVSLRVFDNNGNGGNNYSSNMVRAIQYASANNISIINHSGGGYDYHTNVEDAIRNYPGLFVAAAGNDSWNNDSTVSQFYPASYNLPNIISVGASDKQDRQSGFEWKFSLPTWSWIPTKMSNYGAASVDLFAPGGGDKELNAEMIVSTIPGNTYGYKSGTSMAAPHVTGVAVLLKSKYSNLTASEIKDIIKTSVDKVPQLSSLCVTGGRLNAYNALIEAMYRKNDMPSLPLRHGEAYSIKNVGTGKVFDVSGWNMGNGTNVEQYDFNAGSNQRFIAVYNWDDGTFSFRPIHAPWKMVENVNGNLKVYDNDKVAIIGQRFQVIQRSNGYSIHNQGKAMAVTSSNSASQITPETWNNTSNQKWTFEESWQTAAWSSASNGDGTITASSHAYPEPLWSAFDGKIDFPHFASNGGSGWLQLKLNYSIKIHRIDFYQIMSGSNNGTKNAYFSGTNNVALGSSFVGSSNAGGKTIITVNNVVTDVVRLNVTSAYNNDWGATQIIIFGVRV